MQIHQASRIASYRFSGIDEQTRELNTKLDIVTASCPVKLATSITAATSLCRIARAILNDSFTASLGY